MCYLAIIGHESAYGYGSVTQHVFIDKVLRLMHEINTPMKKTAPIFLAQQSVYVRYKSSTAQTNDGCNATYRQILRCTYSNDRPLVQGTSNLTKYGRGEGIINDCPNKAVLRRQLHEQQRYLPALKSSSPRLFSARELIPELCLPYLNRALSSQTQRDDARGARTLN